MPWYDYHCPICGHRETLERPMADAWRRPVCTTCTAPDASPMTERVVYMDRIWTAPNIPASRTQR